MDTFSLLEKVLYFLKGHAVPVALLIVGLVIGLFFGDMEWFQDVLRVAVGKLVNAGIGISITLLVTKFVFSKINVQETVKNDPVAVAILIGCVFLAVALHF